MMATLLLFMFLLNLKQSVTPILSCSRTISLLSKFRTMRNGLVLWYLLLSIIPGTFWILLLMKVLNMFMRFLISKVMLVVSIRKYWMPFVVLKKLNLLKKIPLFTLVNYNEVLLGDLLVSLPVLHSHSKTIINTTMTKKQRVKASRSM
ncbi:hypothetical protein RO3G_08601 [Rhizopus delemar RA 99-880]|uniref:Uncharacterized protein n=1 Tax=Rhizopus delemar (strain RA 99-880 / ATCC MYA-4621 / FGSC 9543 / NRRL 43880) TaxID=246409 RepID=I1C616_RHIO9|nr:hypothetical protein RO3G_08601 [Rhizopus delemar RA 99-880]|eukprot:EIE83896.1 hypothetical protein RO3G_08601 [Rhizopus delemar RA 99-880]